MDDKILPLLYTDEPAKTVNQNGYKNVNIGYVDSLTNNNIFVKQSNLFGQPDDVPYQHQYEPSHEFYNLFVIGEESFKENHFVVPADRAISSGFTQELLRKRYACLTPNAIDEIKTFPSLFMPEADEYRAEAGADQLAFSGLVENVQLQANGIKITWKCLSQMPMVQLKDIAHELDMLDMNCAITEVNRTHWAIKNVDLLDVFQNNGISFK